MKKNESDSTVYGMPYPRVDSNMLFLQIHIK